MPRDLAAVDLDFLDRAPIRAVTSAVIGHPPDRIWDALTADPPGWTWFPGMSGPGSWVTPAPHGVGSSRRIRLLGTEVTESVLAWDRSRRFAFRVARIALPVPGGRAAAEDYLIHDLGDGRSRVEWTFALDAVGPTGPLTTALQATTTRLWPRAAAALGRHLDRTR